MQSTFRLAAWPGKQDHFNTHNTMPHFPSDINKRKRASSPAPSPLLDTTKKVKVAHPPLQAPLLDVTNAAQDILDTASLAYATPGATPITATHRAEYPLAAPSPPALADFRRTDSVCGESRPEAAPGNQVQSNLGMETTDQEMLDVGGSAAAARETLSPLQQAIENQLNMQILLKHNELRLIAQEEAKCQIALEQLRRCELRPYPGALQPSIDVSCGTGSAILPSVGTAMPPYAAPYGVTDGPYTRHYSQWLLKDPAFDVERATASATVETQEQIASRSTRGAPARKYGSKSIAVPQQAGAFPASLPNYPPPPSRKEKNGPLILRRSTDGRLVKLVCNDCNRGDMNSIQGFLNHCRIAHKVDYKSHDQAAVSCGRPMDDDEIASLPAETQATPVSKPTTRAARMATAPLQPLPHGAVHPYNVQGASLPRSKAAPAARRPLKPVQSLARPTPKTSTQQTPFTPSAQAPHLSALLAKHSSTLDLDHAIAAARRPTDLFAPDEDLVSPRDSSPSSPSFTPVANSSRGKTLPANSFAARPSSRKGYRQAPSHSQNYHPSPLALSRAQQPLPMSESPHAALSPQTGDNPGLISDLEDDDHGSASEEETSVPPSRAGLLPVAARTCAEPEGMDLDVDMQEAMEGMGEGVVIGRKMKMG